ncbi:MULTISPECIES: division/cell wall cluster transcriptional repressor MraZ [unclassified Oribacterium]|jgi:MraZ protein|uniref:division/cell wall cluster transcriptional repressor MraZ n=1 Tax=unclassified Oribacterium TaxID=2629782 RepID=UPI0003FCFDA1|nr:MULTISPECIES: division/cell wall cluster transcriptional repressor MraZ [unclassified Oribacterium]MBO6308538.1 division/cell wall cluster transcriptional repressor MraZ [Oribacterium sp.]MBR1857235.1 division/cell wall cluster transcriptional repressor MraZ [Oribacterium sp.]
MSFTGEYHHNLDAKGRLIIPAKFRDQLGTEFTVTRSLDGCLAMYAAKEWEILENKLNALPMTNEKARGLKRFLLGSANTCELDKQGRILIPPVLRDKANLDKDITLLGVGDHIEIWNADLYNEKYNFDDEEALEADWEGLGI